MLCASLLPQVSKTAPTGEYLVTGSFMIRGRKNYLPPQVGGQVLGSVVGGQWVTTCSALGSCEADFAARRGQVATLHFSTAALLNSCNACPTTSHTATGDGLWLHVWAG